MKSVKDRFHYNLWRMLSWRSCDPLTSKPKRPSVRKIGSEIGIKGALRFDSLPILDGRGNLCENRLLCFHGIFISVVIS